MLELTRLTLRRAREERLTQAAGSLAFSTLLSMVPLLAVGFGLWVRFPAFQRFQAALERHLLDSLLPQDISRTVLRYVGLFAAKAGSLTWVGSLLLLVTAFTMLLTVENVLNRLWAVKRPRPWPQRLALYLPLLLAGPPAAGASVWAASWAMGASAGFFEGLPGSVRVVLDVLPLLLGGAAMACVLRLMPNAPVRWRHALVGGLLVAAGLELGKRGFTAFLLKLPTTKAVYGTFAVLPVSLLWVYFSWCVVLVAALITATLGQAGKRAAARR
jgi:membrane protein